jgi:hypothetical protein
MGFRHIVSDTSAQEDLLAIKTAWVLFVLSNKAFSLIFVQ